MSAFVRIYVRVNAFVHVYMYVQGNVCRYVFVYTSFMFNRVCRFAHAYVIVRFYVCVSSSSESVFDLSDYIYFRILSAEIPSPPPLNKNENY